MIEKFYKYLPSTLFGLFVFIFFGVFYGYHLCYQEGLQLFTFTGEYFFEQVKMPGGLANYMGGLITQFFLYKWIGAATIAIILVVLQVSFAAITSKLGCPRYSHVFSFVAPALLMGALCNENTLISGVMALVFAVLSSLILTSVKNSKVRYVALIAGLPVIFWLFGGIAMLIFGVIGIMFLKIEGEKIRLMRATLYIAVVIVLAYLFTALFKWALACNSFYNIFIGANIFRDANMHLPLWYAGAASLILLVLGHRLLPLPGKTSTGNKLSIILFLLLGVSSAFMFRNNADFKKEQLYKYDYMVRFKGWDAIIMDAERNAPSTMLSQNYLNLALSQKGLLSSRMFEFSQYGTEGLIPEFPDSKIKEIVASEIYYQLGFMNAAEQFAYDAMEEAPDYQKSARQIKRLAEVNIIKGNNALAEKYLIILTHTLFYGDWAWNALRIIRHQQTTGVMSEWIELSKIQIKIDHFFINDGIDLMLEQALVSNKMNKKVFEYLAAFYLLKKDLKAFANLMEYGQHLYHSIPKHYDEAQLYYISAQEPDSYQWLKKNNPSPNMLKMEKCRAFFVSNPHNKEALKHRFGDTYWFYLLY